MALTSKVESYVTYNEHEGLDVRKLEGYITYQDVEHITTDPNYPTKNYLSFNGSDTRGEIPISLKDKTNWEIEFTIASKETRSSSAIYHEPCIIGVDTAGYVSRDMHVDIMNGYLHLFSGLGGSNSVNNLPAGSILNTGSGDYGYRTSKYISDGKSHTIKVSLKDNKLGLIADGEDLGYLTVTNTLGNSSDTIYLGSSYPGERVYGQFDLFYLKVTVDDVVQGEYDLKTINNDYIIDISGNSKNIPLYGTRSYGTTVDKIYIDNTLPEGIGGVVNAYATYNEHSGLDVRKLEIYVTYKEHDNSFDGNVTLNGLQVQETPDSGYYLPLNLTVLENNQPVIKNLAIVPTDIDTEKNIAYITLDDGTKLTYPLHKKS